jgi:hypothetical protein
MKKYKINDLQQFSSNYLNGGWKIDNMALGDILYDKENSCAESTVNIKDYYMPGDGEYHFTAFHAQLMVSELAVFLSHLQSGLNHKTGEAYMREYNMKLTKKITKTNGIKIKLSAKKTKKVNNKFYAKYDIDIDDHSFAGAISLVITL